jgi:class 3 adenylate cyclase/tetratricopeptide (TPR) repeat protein
LRGDERRIVTVLFADLVGYTALSETRDPEQVKRLIDGCFQHLVADIDAFGGRVDKIIGDAIVALFGAPVAHEDDAERAVRAALRMQTTLARVSADLGVEIRMRVGVNTGEVLVGALRSGGDYTAMGDVVNTANRLQTAAGAGQVLVGASTHSATSRVIRYAELEPIAAKGKEEPVPAWRAEATMAPPGYRPDRSRATLIGRDAELGILRHSLDNSFRNARASLLLVLGEAGVGKSRLAEELAAASAQCHDALVLEGRCVPYGEANVWWPVADALRHGCGIRSSDPATKAVALAHEAVRTALGHRAPEAEVDDVLQGLLFLMGYDSELRGIDPSRARETATAAVVTFAERFSMQRPVVVVLSDLHWADDLVLGLVDTLLERLCARRFVVLATARQVIEERWQPPAGRHNLVSLTLDPLTADAAAQLLCELAGEDLDAELAAALLDRSGGNPFFLEELVTLLGEAGGPGRGRAGTADLPDTLRGLVSARLDGLLPDERRVLDDCAVLGRRGSVMSIEVMAKEHLGIDDVGPVLGALEAKELLVLSGTGDAAKWTFRSDMVREVAYGTLTKGDRAKSHAGIAAWMEAHEDTEQDATLDRVTHHYLRAAELATDLGGLDGLADGLAEKALGWLERAATRAEQAEIHVVASRLWGEGLRLLDAEHNEHRVAGDQADGHLQHGDRHRVFLTGRARALAHQRDLGTARADVEAAIAEARSVGGPPDAALGRSLLVLADIQQKDVDFAGSRATLDEAAQLFASLADAPGLAEVQRLRGFDALLRHDHPEAVNLLEDALARFEALGDQRGVAWVHQNLAWSAFYSGQPDKAEARLRTAAATFEELGDTAGVGWAVGLLAWTRYQQGFTAEAEELAESIIDDVRRRNDRWALGMMVVLLGCVRLWTGRANSAIPFLTEAHDLFVEIDDGTGRMQASVNLGRALVAAGRVEEGLAILPGLHPEVEGRTPPIEQQMMTVATAGATVELGAVDLTQRIVDELAAAPPEVSDLFAGSVERVVAAALLAVQQGDPHAGLPILEAHRPLLTKLDTNFESAVAVAEACAGHVDAALAAADLVERHEAASYYDRLLAGLGRALAIAQRGDDGAAVAAFDQLRAAADATDDVVIAAVIRLADALAASARDEADAATRLAEADRHLAELGMSETGGRGGLGVALGIRSAA